MGEFDVIVVGAGTGGYVAAIRAAQLGLQVAVVERQRALGGTCLLWGCIPTKTLLEHAHALKVVQHAAEWGVSIGPGVPSIDMAKVQARKDRVVAGLSKGVEYLFKKHHIAWVKGSARLVGSNLVEVTDGDAQTLRARKEIIVATGSAARSIPGVTIDRTRIITSDEAIALRDVPASVAILGGGAVGVEFASIFRRFGSEVLLLEAQPRLVPTEDEAISAELEKSFRKQGVTCHLGVSVSRASVGDGGVDLDMRSAAGVDEVVRADLLLVATGRGPVTQGLDAERIGLILDRGYIKVDRSYQTNLPGISAVGDVITFGTGSHPQLAHVSSAEGTFVAERIAGRHPEPLNYDRIPSCTYCDPEIGRVGLTERQARERGIDVVVGTFPFGVLGKAKAAGEPEGLVKIVADRAYDEVLGVHMIGARATELVAEATLALELEATVESIMRTVHAHPTMSEAVVEAARAVHGSAIHL